MAKTSANKNTRSQNILELINKLQEHGWLEKFGAELNERKGGEVFKSMFKLFKGLSDREIPLGEIPDDDELCKLLGRKEEQFDTNRRDFYNRIIDFARTAIDTDEKWYLEALDILKEVDVLFALGARAQAEMRFIKIYKIFPTDESFRNKREYNYVLSKMFYYGMTFFAAHSDLNMAAAHKEFFQKDQFHLIKELETIANNLDIRKPLHGEQEKWKINRAVFGYLNVLATLAKQKKEFAQARTILNKQEEMYADMKRNYVFRHEGGKRAFNWYPDNEPQNADEIVTAFYYYIKMEEFRLSILDGDPFQAQNILQELYGKLNETFDKSRNNLAAIILFLRIELEQSQYALSLTRKELKDKALEFTDSFLATKNEIDLLPVRLELNRMTFELITSPERMVFEKVKADIKELEGQLRGKAPEIKLHLSVLKLLACFESQQYEGMTEAIKSVKFALNESKRKSKFINQFLLKIAKVNYANHVGFAKEFTKILEEIEPDRDDKDHLDNLVAFWLRQFGSRRLA